MKFNKWSIWRAGLDPVIGSEQGKARPVIIISEDDINELLNIVSIIPITTRKTGRIIYPNEVLVPAEKFGLKHESIALCHQIRTIDKRRLTRHLGNISEEELQNLVLEAICFQLGINKE